MNTAFHNSFTVRFRRKFSIDHIESLPPNVSCVATLPCEIWKSYIFVFQKQPLPFSYIFFHSALCVAAKQSESKPRRLRSVGSYKIVRTNTISSRTWKSCASVSRRNVTVWTRKWSTMRSVNGASD